jgi:hypothetical protein
MRKTLLIIFVIGIALNAYACTPDRNDPENPPSLSETPQPEQLNDNNDDMKIQLTIGSTAFTATLVDNAEATAFRAILPITVSMSELNGNEKYYYLPGTLPTSASNPETIRTGDLSYMGIMDLNGSVILQSNRNIVDISNLLSGFYLVKMDTRTNTQVRKIVKR